MKHYEIPQESGEGVGIILRCKAIDASKSGMKISKVNMLKDLV